MLHRHELFLSLVFYAARFHLSILDRFIGLFLMYDGQLSRASFGRFLEFRFTSDLTQIAAKMPPRVFALVSALERA